MSENGEGEGDRAKEVDARIRGKVKGAIPDAAGAIFDDPNFQKKMNRWMIGTHLNWGFILAGLFVGLTQLMSWIQTTYGVTNFEVGIVLTPTTSAYLFYQWWKFRHVPRGTPPRPEGRPT